MSILDFEKAMNSLINDPEIRAAWFTYLSQFSYLGGYFKNSTNYENQYGYINGRKTSGDINLYKLFIEQSYNLLRKGGMAGMVVPSGVHTDLGTMQLRKMLFEQSIITGIFGIENRKEVFEGVHRSFKFDILTFQKGNTTQDFPAAFMRHDVKELEHFPQHGGLSMPVSLIKRVSPGSWSVPEFKCEMDEIIAEKMLKYPLLGDEIDGKKYIQLSQEINMTSDSHLFKTSPGPGRLPLYEGKMIWQFDSHYAEPRYWVDEKEGRKALLGRNPDRGQMMDYQGYRLGVRSIASNTNERTLICSILPKHVFCGNSFLADSTSSGSYLYLPYKLALLNSFIIDWYLRNMVTTNINMFYLYQLPIPRLEPSTPEFRTISKHSAKLIFNTIEFDVLAKSVGLGGHQEGVSDPFKRVQIRAELDALVAHLYGLTEEEFAHVLSTFPIVSDEVKGATMREFLK